VGLLEALHEHEWEMRGLRGCEGRVSDEEWKRPAVRFKRRSWDLMSPDSIRPYTVSNLGDIAILLRRLGITWTGFCEVLVQKLFVSF